MIGGGGLEGEDEEALIEERFGVGDEGAIEEGSEGAGSQLEWGVGIKPGEKARLGGDGNEVGEGPVELKQFSCKPAGDSFCQIELISASENFDEGIGRARRFKEDGEAIERERGCFADVADGGIGGGKTEATPLLGFKEIELVETARAEVVWGGILAMEAKRGIEKINDLQGGRRWGVY